MLIIFCGDYLNKLRGLLVEPDKLPVEIEFEDSLKSMQRLVEGLICQESPIDDDSVVFILNDESKINGMFPNRDIGYDIIFGPFIIVGNDYENECFRSLTNQEIEKYKKIFNDDSILATKLKVVKMFLEVISRKKAREKERE